MVNIFFYPNLRITFKKQNEIHFSEISHKLYFNPKTGLF